MGSAVDVVDHQPQPTFGEHRPDHCWRAGADDPAVVDEGDAVAERLGLGHVVSGEQDRSPFSSQFLGQSGA
jgi:hypothetical protein